MSYIYTEKKHEDKHRRVLLKISTVNDRHRQMINKRSISRDPQKTAK